MELVTLTEKEYHAFAEHHPYSNFLNSIYSGRKFTQRQWDVEYLGLKHQTTLQAAVLLVSTPLRKYRYYYAPRGFLIDYHSEELLSEFTSRLIDHMKKANGLYMKIDPYVSYREHDIDGNLLTGGFHHQQIIDHMKMLGYEHEGFTIGYNGNSQSQCRWMSVLDIRNKTADQLLKDMNAQTRQNIKNTIKNNIKVRKLAYDELSILDDIVNVTSERRGFSNLSLTFYQEEYNLFEDHAQAYYAYLDIEDYQQRIKADMESEKEIIQIAQSALLVNPHSKNSKSRLSTAQQHLNALEKRKAEADQLSQAHGRELPLAAAMFIMYGHEVVYLTSGSYDEFKRFKGPYALQWHMIQLAIEKGYSYYNFYGISGCFEKGEEGYGVFDFKRGFKADVVELIGDFILPVQPKAYQIYRNLQQLKQKMKRS